MIERSGGPAVGETVAVSVVEVLFAALQSPVVDMAAVLLAIPTAAAAKSTLIVTLLNPLVAIGPGLVQAAVVVPEQLQPFANPLTELKVIPVGSVSVIVIAAVVGPAEKPLLTLKE